MLNRYTIAIPLLAIYYFYVFSFFGCQKEQKALQKQSVMLTNHPKLSSSSYLDIRIPPKDRTPVGRENATLVMLVRNRELDGALRSMRSLEDRFNHHYKYPWVFMNDVPFDQDFIEQTTLMASGETFYELIPEQDWNPPSFIDDDKYDEAVRTSVQNNVIYGHSKSYRNMCRFNSGFFFKQKKLLEYEWYFRVEPEVEYMCDFQYDPFEFLRRNNKLYGFVTTIHEYENTIPTLWNTVEDFMQKYPEVLHPHNSLDFFTTNESEINHGVNTPRSSTRYNLCHFWSNFEIGNLNFWRSKPYQTFFDHLDKSGGFYYERWGDAPVHSIGLGLLLDRDQIHHFEDIGYYHAPYMACPTAKDVLASKRCICVTNGLGKEVIEKPYDVQVFSCLSRWWRYGSGKRFLNEIDYVYQP